MRLPAVPGRSEVWSDVLAFLSGRTGRIAAQAGVLAAVVGGTVMFTHIDKTVHLTVDGRAHDVRVDAGTVRGLLTAERIALGPHDLVAPKLDTRLHDGSDVVIRYARQLVLTVDGRTKVYWVTDNTVEAALRQLGIRADGARLSASRSEPIGRSGLQLSVSTPKAVTISADGRTANVVSTAPTVADLLAEQGITLGTADRVSVLPATPVTAGLVVAVTRVEHKTITATESVSFGTTEKKSATMYVGQRKVLSSGVKGRRTATYTVVLVNGRQTGRTLISATVLKTPVNQVVAVGTKAKPAVSSSVGGSVDSLNWAALAQCESGGNPRAVNPAGYYGLYQFSLSTWRSVGGTGNPIDASSSEQLLRAKLLYKKAGAGQWGCGAKLFS